jgi:hypothetical protein
MEYRCVATSVEGFVQQLAVAYVRHGYWFYVTGRIPQDKDPAAVDRKLIERYGIAISKWARARRKQQGLANIQYLRYERFFVLIATKGRHDFREREAAVIRDIRRVPISFGGYSISCRKGVDGRWHASVRIHPVRYRDLKAYLLGLACRRSAEWLGDYLQNVSYEAYAPVRRQMFNFMRAVNRVRKQAGLDPLPMGSVRVRRRIVKPFDEEGAGVAGGCSTTTSQGEAMFPVRMA